MGEWLTCDPACVTIDEVITKKSGRAICVQQITRPKANSREGLPLSGELYLAPAVYQSGAFAFFASGKG